MKKEESLLVVVMAAEQRKAKRHAPKHPPKLTHLCERDERGHMWPDQKMSSLERQFLNCWWHNNGPDLERETLFDVESCAEASDGKARTGRLWRSDFTHRASRTLIEIEGGAWSGGRHTRGKGFEEDAEKYLRAWELGWSVLRLSAKQVTICGVARIVARLRGDGAEMAKPGWLADCSQSLPPPAHLK